MSDPLPWRRDGRGVSSVLGSVLLFGLVVVVFSTLRVSFVPQWENDREAHQMLVAQDQFASFKSSLDRLVANQTTSSIASTLDLGSPHTSFLGTFGASGAVSFMPDTSGPQVSADQFQLVLRNGNAVGGETWTPVSGTGPLTNVGSVASLRLRFSTSESEVHKNKDSVQMQVKDSAGAVLGTFVAVLYCDKDCKAKDNLYLNIESDDAGGNVLYDQGYAVNDPANSKSRATYWVDVLDPTYRFGQLLRAAPVPFSIALFDDGLNAQYAITYSQVTSQGRVAVGGQAQATPLSANLGGGTLSFHAANQYFPQQVLVLEGGVLVLDQPGTGQAFIIPPDFRVTPLGTSVAVTLGTSALTGTESQITGATNVQLSARVAAVSSFAGQTPHFTVNYTTEFPALYKGFFTDRLGAAGLQSVGCSNGGPRPTCNFAISMGASWVRLELYGYTNSPADNASETPVFDINVIVSSGSLEFNLIP